jgi:ACR3 family arsenite efflux pump ArsB
LDWDDGPLLSSKASPEIFEVAKINLPVGLLIWVMIIPMLVKVDFGALRAVRQHVRGIP